VGRVGFSGRQGGLNNPPRAGSPPHILLVADFDFGDGSAQGDGVDQFGAVGVGGIYGRELELLGTALRLDGRGEAVVLGVDEHGAGTIYLQFVVAGNELERAHFGGLGQSDIVGFAARESEAGDCEHTNQ
jgi:hypothetical protein